VKLKPEARESLTFIRRWWWAMSPFWVLAAALSSWLLPAAVVEALVVLCNLALIALVLLDRTPDRLGAKARAAAMVAATSYMFFVTAYAVRWGFFD
jgi:hypothetical protein